MSKRHRAFTYLNSGAKRNEDGGWHRRQCALFTIFVVFLSVFSFSCIVSFFLKNNNRGTR